jgi:hypothetical protein
MLAGRSWSAASAVVLLLAGCGSEDDDSASGLAEGESTQPCGTDYAAEPVESEKAVVVVVLEQPNGFRDGTCTMMGMNRTATLNLAIPLGDRAVLSIPGEPVPVTRAQTQKLTAIGAHRSPHVLGCRHD